MADCLQLSPKSYPLPVFPFFLSCLIVQKIFNAVVYLAQLHVVFNNSFLDKPELFFYIGLF